MSSSSASCTTTSSPSSSSSSSSVNHHPSPPLRTATAASAIVFLHGLDSKPSDWLGWVEWLATKLGPECKTECPAAPVMKITKNSGEEMTAWFDVLAPWPVTPSWKNDTAGIATSVETVHRLIDRLVSEEGIPCERIVIGGFSQGAVLAFASVYSFRKRLGGCMMLSGWIDLETAATEVFNTDTPLFWGHGVEDEIVTLENQIAGAAFLREKVGLSSVLAKQYAVGHDITEEETGDAVVFVTAALSS